MDVHIVSDLYRICGRTDTPTFICKFFRNPAFRYLALFRLRSGGGTLGRLLWKIRPRRGLDFGVGARIGYGLYIGHGGPVVINETAVS